VGGIVKSPRRYAEDYLSAKTPEQKKKAVAGCPVEWQGLVRAHVRSARRGKNNV
jgi:hypothetical protein